MKIAVVSSGHIPSQWAHSINILKTANAFHYLGHEVEVLTVERFPEKKMKQKIKDIHRFYGISENLKISNFKDNPLFYLEELKPFNYILWFLKKITRNRIRYISDPEKRISEYCWKNSVDVCYCRSYRTVYYNIRNEIPTIMESHTPNITHPDLQRVIKQSHFKYFKGLVTTSDILKENFINAGVPEDKILTLQDGVDVESFQNLPSKEETRGGTGLPKDKKIVTYCGSLFRDKGIEHILLVAKTMPDVLFLLVGGRLPQISMWKKYASSRGIKNVQFAGFVQNAVVPLYLKAADALIMPYKTDQEIKIMDMSTTSPLKLFEYMASKRPIVSSNVPAISRTITHGVDGLLAKPNDVRELAHFVKVVLEDKKLAENLSNNAYEKAKRYDWKKRCEMILQHVEIGDK
jgi:glycosyltransferase involved in cell wall biosynthesis